MKITFSHRIIFTVATIMALAVMSSAAVADTDREVTRLTREMRQVQAKLTAAQQENVSLSAQIEALKKQISLAETKGSVLEKKSKGQSKQVDELTEKYQETDKNLQKTMQLLAAMTESQKQTQLEKEQERKRLEGVIQVCEKRNADLYQVSVDMMNRYQSKGVVDALLQKEPFTGIEKVRVDNVMQDYRDKAADARFTSGIAPAADTGNPAPNAARP